MIVQGTYYFINRSGITLYHLTLDFYFIHCVPDISFPLFWQCLGIGIIKLSYPFGYVWLPVSCELFLLVEFDCLSYCGVITNNPSSRESALLKNWLFPICLESIQSSSSYNRENTWSRINVLWRWHQFQVDIHSLFAIYFNSFLTLLVGVWGFVLWAFEASEGFVSFEIEEEEKSPCLTRYRKRPHYYPLFLPLPARYTLKHKICEGGRNQKHFKSCFKNSHEARLTGRSITQ